MRHCRSLPYGRFSFFFSSRRRHTRCGRDWSSDVCSSDLILESGLGGVTGCDVTQIMPIGTVAHETGHGFGLPDLYSTDGSSEGIGEYGLMSSGNYTTGVSPSRMDAWSLNELGWVTRSPVT